MELGRRDILKMIALLTGSAMVGIEKWSQAAVASSPTRFLDTRDIALLDEISDTIIPDTDTPGAKAAKIGAFMNVYVRDCYTPEQQSVFRSGLKTLDAECVKTHRKRFVECSKDQRHELLGKLERQAKEHNAKKTDKNVDHYYTMIKQLTLFGYFTSEIGATKALRHVRVPARYDGAFPYKKGDRAFSP